LILNKGELVKDVTKGEWSLEALRSFFMEEIAVTEGESSTPLP
jgi:hypothetical protein